MTPGGRDARRLLDDGDLQEPLFPAAALARVLGGQYVMGGLLALAWVLGPQTAPPHGARVVTVLAALSLLLGTVMFTLSRSRLSASTLGTSIHVCIISAQLVIGAGFAVTASPFNHLLLFLLWTTPYAGVFTHRARLLHGAGTAAVLVAAYALAVAQGVAVYAAVVGCALTVTTVTIVTLLVARVTDALRRQALTDTLTGLPNRRAFAAATRAALDAGEAVAVVLIDLDRFKNVNDTYGHHAGDTLLLDLAPRLTALTRADDVVARLGGDEFAVLLRGVDAESAQVAAARYAEAWRAPIMLEHGPILLSGSTGLTLAGPDSTPQSLLREADAAMYGAKGRGDARPAVFEPSLQVASARRLALESDLRIALADGHLQVHYQPVVVERDGVRTVVGVEALARWTHPRLGPVGPEEFVRVAESTGCIDALGAQVMRRAVVDLAGWRACGQVHPSFTVAVNVSPLQLDDDLPGLVASLLCEYGLPASCLGVEVTESAVVVGGPAERALASLHDLGVVLLLDDFGTGASSLAQLRRFPFDVVKIDRAFVASLHAAPADRSLVRAILSMAGALGLDVLAEGVETAAQAWLLAELGCTTTQGWLHAPAVPAADLPQVLRQLQQPLGQVSRG